MKARTLMLGKRNQVTLPRELIPEGTTLFQGEQLPNGSILLIPQVSIPVSQAYFWTKRWQEGEAKASQDIQAKRLRHHRSAADLVAHLDRQRKK